MQLYTMFLRHFSLYLLLQANATAFQFHVSVSFCLRHYIYACTQFLTEQHFNKRSYAISREHITLQIATRIRKQANK